MTTKNQLFKIGLDLGYGQIKGINELNYKKKFPALLNIGKNRDLDKLFINTNDLINNLHVQLNINNTSKDYFVGNLAREQMNRIPFLNANNKINSEENMVFLSTLIGLLLPESFNSTDTRLHICTGLPLEHFSKQRDQLKDLLQNFKIDINFVDQNIKKTALISKVSLFPQGAGAIYKIIRSNHDKYLIRNSFIALIDIGFKTTDIVVFQIASNGTLKFISNMSATLDEVGISKILNGIDKSFTKDSLSGEQLSTDQLLNLYETNEIFYNGSLLNYSRRIDTLKSQLAKEIKNKLDGLWNGERGMMGFNSIILSGGGGAALYPYFQNMFPKLKINVDLSKNAEFANAEGFLLYAENCN